jgi:hypothetical protein
MANGLKVAVAWFRAEDYERIRQISAGGMPATFADWEAKMTKALARSGVAEILAEKVIVDPDELLAFARHTGAGKIDNQMRSRFATLKLLGERASLTDATRLHLSCACEDTAPLQGGPEPSQKGLGG